MGNDLDVWFDHGLGDCVQFVALLQLYTRRGWRVRAHYEANKAAVFEAGGIPHLADPVADRYHPWPYHPDFNHPDPAREGSGNKTYHNLNTRVLPPLGDRDELWRELCGLDLRDRFDALITPDLRGRVADFLRHLPRPVVLLHTKGTNFQDAKSIPDRVAVDLYRRLLDGMPGTLVLCDWDDRVPAPPHGRIRHLRRDWGHVTTLEFAALLSAADLLVGVDSGPWHLSNLTRTPALGVFHDFFPWCVSLPSAALKSAVLTRDSHPHATVPRRKVWSPVEYPAPMPTADDIARTALRMLAGPRYGCPIGRDVMLQHLVRDKLSAGTGTSPIADRHNTMDHLFRQLARLPDPQFVETGCVRGDEDWSAGSFTYLAGCWLDGRNAGHLVSVDIDPRHCATARRLVAPWAGRVTVVESDSVAYLRGRAAPVDVLYLDSLDADVPGHTEHGLRETLAGERLVRAGGYIVFDDTVYAGGWTGKGAMAVPHLLDRGWTLEASGYQAVLRRPPSAPPRPSTA